MVLVSWSCVGGADDRVGLVASDEVVPGGDFLGCPPSRSRYENAFHAPLLSDWRPFETWAEDGAPETSRRAQKYYEDLLKTYQPPEVDTGVMEQLTAFVARRKAEIGTADID